ncbi:MAG TPA: ABC transporter substrate-binding protein [Gaiellaceae bacterium]|jgi:peptide/nickel transport system substrate-binding protein
MRRTIPVVVAVTAALTMILTGCGGSSGTNATGSGASQVTEGGILRVGTINYIDSLNPFHYIEAQAYQAFIMLYPQLVQYDFKDGKYVIVGDLAKSWETSKDGKDWTFHLVSGTKWSDGQPMTAEDVAWTANTTIKYGTGPTAVMAPALAHLKTAEAPDPATVVLHYNAPVGNALAQLEQFFVLPEHIWKQYAVGDGKGLKTYAPENNLSSMVTGGAFTLKQYEKKGTTVFLPDPNYWGEKPHVQAVALTYYTNADSMIADMKAGQVDWVDQVPFNAVDVLKKDSSIVVQQIPGAETTNITWNSNPYKDENRELLDPQVKKALSMCVDRDKLIEVVFNGYADKVESLPGTISLYENKNLGPLEHNCAEGNAMLDQLGYKKGPDGIRVVPATTGKYAQPAHKMQYEIMQPTSLDFNGPRSFDIVKEGFAEAGVDVTLKVGGDSTAAYAIETTDHCDAKTNSGYTGWDIAMWDWIGYVDPDFMLSVVTKDQWCSWSDTGWDNPDYDKLYEKQGTTVDEGKRAAIVQQMEQIIYDNVLYTQLVEEQYIDAHTTQWDGMDPHLNAYAKMYWTRPYKVG